jgi:hypothetical protein
LIIALLVQFVFGQHLIFQNKQMLETVTECVLKSLKCRTLGSIVLLLFEMFELDEQILPADQFLKRLTNATDAYFVKLFVMQNTLVQ